ncbi:MAG: N-acetyltransferase [Acidimicrobiia bacterium]|nr:N-acetyltransferase [Acidimicrobiia bacterium]
MGRSAKPLVPDDFAVPERLDGPGFRLEPLGPRHNERDYAAWMSSIDHIRATPGFSPEGDWPQPMSLQENLADLEMHERHFAERSGFTFTVLEHDDVVGCVYIYPTTDPEFDVEVRAWVTAARSDLDGVLRMRLADWLDDAWPFDRVLIAGR